MLEQGTKLESIFWSDEEHITIGEGGCLSIEVTMENGQMAGVPWAFATYENRDKRLFNLALAEGVKLTNA